MIILFDLLFGIPCSFDYKFQNADISFVSFRWFVAVPCHVSKFAVLHFNRRKNEKLKCVLSLFRLLLLSIVFVVYYLLL